MSKKIKLVAIIETEDNVVIDDSAIENSVGSLGIVKSYKIDLDDANENDNKSQEGSISSDLYSELNAHFNDGEIYELGMIMAVLVGVAKFTFVFDLVEKEEYCPF